MPIVPHRRQYLFCIMSYIEHEKEKLEKRMEWLERMLQSAMQTIRTSGKDGKTISNINCCHLHCTRQFQVSLQMLDTFMKLTFDAIPSSFVSSESQYAGIYALLAPEFYVAHQENFCGF
jgi:hypothetical protein